MGILRINLLKERNNQLLRRVEKARDEAIAASNAKSDFLAYTAHELRNPLSSLITSRDLIESDRMGPISSQCREYVRTIRHNATDLLRFIRDLLDAMRCENTDFSYLENQWLDVDDHIRRSVQLNITRANQQLVNINIETDENIPQLLGDSLRIRQCLINLISNSIKYSPSETTITIKTFVN